LNMALRALTGSGQWLIKLVEHEHIPAHHPLPIADHP